MLCRLGINLLHQAILDFRLRYALSTTDKGLQKFQSCFNLNSLTLLCRFHCVNNILHDFFRLQGVPVNIKKFSKCIKWNWICTGKVKQSTVTRGNVIRSTHHIWNLNYLLSQTLNWFWSKQYKLQKNKERFWINSFVRSIT